ncbi:Clp protease N-terminal domain-containing protein [Planotetraspora sp. GP83]|uniref:Clp protease N-terminal domain-containing protein n=1 Tax=Planotetraspora sp. GP83 TaxID=3156264 RepID=UPI0035144877
MPKINVYLPDELAEAVKEAGLPVSAICQRALEQAVRRVTAIREAVVGDLELDDPAGRLAHFTARARAVFKLALERARADGSPSVGTEHLLAGMLAEGGNLALHVLRAVEVDPDLVGRDLARQAPTQSEPAEEGAEEGAEGDTVRQFSGAAANVLELAVTEAQTLGHNYVGCEHLLLGLIIEPDGTAGQILRARGAEPRLTRRAVVAALAGYVHLRAQTQGAIPAYGTASEAAGAKTTATAEDTTPATATTGTATQAATAAVLGQVAAVVRQELEPLTERIRRLEEHAGIPADPAT